MRPMLPMTLSCRLLAVGCAPTPEAPPPGIDLAAERASLMRADQDWFQAYSMSDSPVDVFVDALLDDAHLLPPGAPLAAGKDAIAAVITQLEAMPGFSIQWSPTLADAGDGGSLGYTMGTYEMRLEGPDGLPMKIDGKYITVWVKQADGSWKVAADMFNDDGPPPLRWNPRRTDPTRWMQKLSPDCPSGRWPKGSLGLRSCA